MGTLNNSARVYQVVDNQPVLIAVMPTLDKQRLTNRLIGAINAAFPRLNLRAYQALRALLSHCGYHSNRVWASLKRLGKLIVGQSDTSTDQGYKLAERGIADLLKAGLIRIIEDEKELLSGPGEHQYLAAGKEKQGDGAVNHYDLTPLTAFIDEDDRKEWDIIIRRRAERLSPEPPSDLSAVWSGQAEFPPTRIPQPDPDEYEDPFASEEEKAARAERMEARRALAEFAANTTNVVTDSSNVSQSSPACPSYLYMVPTHHIEPCNVTQRLTNNEEKRADGAQPNAVGREFFGKTEVSSIKTSTPAHTYTREANGQNHNQASALPLLSLLTRKRVNGGFEFDLPGAQSLIRHYSEPFLRTLLEYTLWMEQQTGAVYGPGWIINTARNFKTWPQEFAQHQSRERQRQEKERQRAEKQAKAQQEALSAVAEPLQGIWDKLKAGLRELPTIRESLWQMHIRPLSIARLDGDVVTIQAASKAGYEVLSLNHVPAFTEALRLLLKRDALIVTFTRPEEP